MKLVMPALVLMIGCGGDSASPDAPAPAPETSCFDGLDNNGDGLADCADPTCAEAAACVAEIPAGWDGYVALFDGATATLPATCSAGFSTLAPAGMRELTAAPATCGACTCGAPSGGACASSGGQATVPMATWTQTGLTCAGVTVAAGCTGGASCQPRSRAPFAAGVCIHEAGEQACPTGFDDRHVLYATIDDTRGCTSCSCGAPSGGVCAPAGGEPTGTAAAAGATTICCAR